MQLIDLTGQVFSRLTVLGKLPERRTKKKCVQWMCQCSCGKKIAVAGENLRYGVTKSCGCFKLEQAVKTNTTHGLHRTSVYRVWRGMLNRCYNENEPSYPRYGGRGITVCPEWRNDAAAFAAHIGPRPKGMTLDRINNEEGYNIGNVRWATYKVQNNNRRDSVRVLYRGEKVSMMELAGDDQKKYDRLRRQIFRDKVPVEEAVDRLMLA